MTENFAGWVGEAPGAAESAPEAPGVPSWLPPGVARIQAEENARQAQAARAEQRARADRAEVARDQAVSAYIRTAAARGEMVSGMDIANGNVGKTLHDVLFGDAAEVAGRIPRGDRDRLAPRGSAENPELLDLQPVVALAVGEAPPAMRSTVRTPSGREMSNRLRRWREAVEARRAAEAAQARSDEDFPEVARERHRAEREASRRPVSRRSAAPAGAYGLESYEELLALPKGKSSRGGCPPCDDCDYVICRCSQRPPGASSRAAYAGPGWLSRETETGFVIR